MLLEVVLEVGDEELLQRLEGLTTLVVIALELRQVLQLLQLLAALAVVVELLLDHVIREGGIVCIRELEVTGRSDRAVAAYIVGDPVEGIVIDTQVVNHRGQRVIRESDVGEDTTCITDLTACTRVKDLRQAVGQDRSALTLT